jgi:hypothetical protein
MRHYTKYKHTLLYKIVQQKQNSILKWIIFSNFSKTIKHKAIYRCSKSAMESYKCIKAGPLKTVAYFSKVYILELYIKPAHY